MAVKRTRKLPGSVWFYLFLKDGEFTGVKRDAVLLTSMWKRHHFCQKWCKGVGYGVGLRGGAFLYKIWLSTPHPGKTLNTVSCNLSRNQFCFPLWCLKKWPMVWHTEKYNLAVHYTAIHLMLQCNALPVICVATKIRDKLHETWPVAVLLRWELTILMPAYAEYPMM